MLDIIFKIFQFFSTLSQTAAVPPTKQKIFLHIVPVSIIASWYNFFFYLLIL